MTPLGMGVNQQGLIIPPPLTGSQESGISISISNKSHQRSSTPSTTIDDKDVNDSEGLLFFLLIFFLIKLHLT